MGMLEEYRSHQRKRPIPHLLGGMQLQYERRDVMQIACRDNDTYGRGCGDKLQLDQQQ